jgi:DNA polymerase-1
MDNPNHILWEYNCRDCVYTREVGEVSAAAVASLGLSKVDAFQHALFPAVLKAMLKGVRIDLKARAEMSRTLARESAAREDYFLAVLGHPLNPRSTKQMQALFYSDLRLPTVWKKTPAGTVPTLDDKALELLARKEPLVRPLIRAIQEYRSLGVFRSTFVEAKLDEDDRMRCSYNICGTETYRFSSSKNAFGSGTNLQNIPKGGEDDDSELELPNIRSLFIPDEGHTFFDIDLSKADLRVVAWEAGENEMKAMLAEGRDPYTETAREFYRDPTITKLRSDGSENPKYKMFKSFGHGTHYLGTPQGLAQRLGLTIHEATRTQAWYLGKYRKIAEWQTRFKAEITRTHSVSNKFGYRRHYFGRIDDSVYREAIAWLPQSTVGCLINRIWLAIHITAPRVETLLQVHDSLAGQFPTVEVEASLDHIRRCGRVVIPYDDPLIIPIGIKTSEKSWGDCD